MKTNIKQIVLSAVSGILCGILMSILVLYMMISTGFTVGSPGFYLELIIVCALPHCLNIARNSGLVTGVAKFCMLVTSFAITFLYAGAVTSSSSLAANYTNLYGTITVLSAILHGSSVLVILLLSAFRTIRTWIKLRRNKRTKDR